MGYSVVGMYQVHKQQTGGNALAVVLHWGSSSDTVADPSAKSANQLLLS